MTTINGQCHCGNISYRIDTALPLSEIVARACDCSFCRIHGAKNWSEPEGRALIVIQHEQWLNRYTFALKTAEFFICRQCGAYAGAVLTDGQSSWATLNLRLSSLPGIRGQPVTFAGEDTAGRVARRKQVWIPVSIEVAAHA